MTPVSSSTYYCCTVQSGNAALSTQKLPRVASRGREVAKSRQGPFRGYGDPLSAEWQECADRLAWRADDAQEMAESTEKQAGADANPNGAPEDEIRKKDETMNDVKQGDSESSRR